MLDRRCVLGASFFVLCSWRSGFVLVLVVGLVDLVVRHANRKQQTANNEQGTRNNGQRVVVAVVVCPRVCELCAVGG